MLELMACRCRCSNVVVVVAVGCRSEVAVGVVVVTVEVCPGCPPVGCRSWARPASDPRRRFNIYQELCSCLRPDQPCVSTSQHIAGYRASPGPWLSARSDVQQSWSRGTCDVFYNTHTHTYAHTNVHPRIVGLGPHT